MMPNKKLKRLDSVGAVFDVLDGTRAVSEMMEVPYRTALNWKNLYRKMPARTYRAIQKALAKKGYVGDDALWGMVDVG
jgi:hypothetical protein